MIAGWNARHLPRRLAAAAAVSALAAFSPLAAAQTPELVVHNATVFTAAAQPSAEAFAVRDGRFVAVGTSADILKLAGPATKIIDLKGAFVTPGLSDGHFHNEGGGPGVDLANVRSIAELTAAVASAAKGAVPGDLIVSNADWHEAQLKEQRLPTARELQLAAPGNPVVLVRGGHDYILNEAALRKFNVSKDTPEPAGGAITKDEAGELTGELVDNAKNFVTLPSPAAVTLDDVLTTQRRLNAYGITSVRVPGAYKGEFFKGLDAILEARKGGLLSLRYTIYLPGFGIRDPDKVRQVIARSPLKQDEGDDWVRIGGVKLLVDGGFEGGRMSKPFAGAFGKNGTYFGLMVVPQEDFTKVIRAINDAGWRATVHAVGDAGLDEVLEAYEAADADKPIAGKRWAVEHLFVTRPEQLVRMKKLGLMLSVQDHLYLAAPALKNYLGMDRASQVTPVKSLLDAGFVVAGGTDSPVVPFNPFWAIYHFLTRDTITDGVYGANERVASRIEVLRMFTVNFAKLTGESEIKGSIEPGKLADFAVLSDNLLEVEEKRIPQMKALLTYVGGREVYRDAAWK